MKNQRIFYMLILFLVSMIALTAVSAAEDATSDIASIEENEAISLEETPIEESTLNDANEEISLEETPIEESTLNDANEELILEENLDDKNNLADTEETLLGETTGTFTDLNNAINGNTDTVIYLTRNYTYTPDDGDDLKNGININRGVTIYGDGYTINGNDEARIFNILSKDVILRNINFVGGNAPRESIIVDSCGGAINGKAIAVGCTFTNNKADFGGALYASTAIDCTFTNNSDRNGYAIDNSKAIRCTFNGGQWNPNNCDNSDRLFIKVDDYESFYNSGVPYTVEIKYGDSSFDVLEGIKMGITIYKDYVQVQNESFYTEKGHELYLNLTPGEYFASVSTMYIPEIEAVSFNVNISKANSVIDASAVTIPYGKDEYLYASLLENKDSSPDKIKNATISVDIDGDSKDYVTGSDGKIAIPLKDLTVGPHTATFTFGGNDCYNGNTTTVEINILKDNSSIHCDEIIEKPYNSNEKIIIQLENEDLDETINGAVINVNINGSETNYTTNEYGQIEVPINMLNVGNYSATITYGGNETVEGKSKTISIKIRMQDTSLSASDLTTGYNSNDNLIVTLIGEEGNPINGAEIIIGSPFNERYTTNSSGQVSIPIAEKEINVYSVFIEFAGNEGYAASNTTAIINITKGTPVIIADDTYRAYWGETAIINFTTENQIGYPISGLVKVEIDDHTYYKEIGEDGKGQVEFIADIRPGEYDVIFTFFSDDYYNKVSTQSRLNIEESRKLNLVISANETSFGEDTILEVKAHDGRGQLVTISKLNVTVADGTTEIYDVVDGRINLGKLVVGPNFIEVNYSDDNYNSTSANITVTVNPATPDITVTPGDANVTVEAKDGDNPISGTVKIYIDGDTENPITASIDETGKVTVPLTGLSEGNHAAEVVFSSQNYTTTSKIVLIKANKISPTLEVTGSEAEYGEPNTITVKLTGKNGEIEEGIVIITILAEGNDGVQAVIDLAETKEANVRLDLEGLAPGTYNVSAKYLANDKYNEAINNTEKVTLKDTTELNIEATPNTPIYGEDATINIKIIDGKGSEIEASKVNITIGEGEAKEYTITDGVVNLGILPAGIKIINISYVDETHNLTTETATLQVTPAGANMTVTPGEANVSIELKEGEKPISATIIIYIDGDTENPIDATIDETGKTTVPLNGLNPGNHAVEVVFINENYTIASQTVAVNIPKYVPVMTVTGSTVPSDSDSTVTIKLTDKNGTPIKGTVLVTVNYGGGTAKDIVELDENGEGQAKLSIDTPGTFAVNAEFIGNENYSSIVNDTEKVTITALNNITFNAAINEDLTEIIITDAKDNATGQTVNGVIAGSLTKGYDSIELENISLAEGKGTIKIPEGLEPGTYTACLILETDDGQYAFNFDVKFTIAKHATAIDVKDVTVQTVNETIEGKVVEYFTFTLKDNEGKPIAAKDVQVKMDGTVYNLTTDANGTAKIQIDLSKAKTYNLAIFYIGDQNYEASFEQAKITVKAQTPKLTANSPTYLATAKTKSITATLKDAKGNALAGKAITFTVNGKTYKATTNAKGIATAKLALTAAKTYTVSIKFAGDSVYAASTVTAKVKLNKEKTKITAPKKTFKKAKKVKKVVITLKNSKGKAIAKKKITLTVNKKKYTAKTNKKGKATFKIKKLTKKGTKKYTVKFAGDTQYKAVKKTGKIRIK